MGYQPLPPVGQDDMAGSLPVVIASDQSALIVDLGANNDVTLATLPDTAAGDLAAINASTDGIETLLGTIDTDTGAIATSVASIDTKTPALGQALAAASVPVVLTAAQITTLTPPAAITGFATETTLAAVKTAVEAIQAGQLPDSHNVTVDNASLAVTGTFWQATQPVSGTVTANLSATDNAVLDTIASPVATISATPLQRIAIFDDNDTQITSFGGGTQYTEGDTAASITGTALMFEISPLTDELGVVSGDQPLPVVLSEDVPLAVQLDDDSAFSATSGVLPIAFVFDDTAPDSVDEGDAGYGRMSANRNQYMTIRDAAGNERGVNVNASNQLTVLADLGATDNAVLDAIAASAAAIDGHVDGLETSNSAIQTSVELIDDTVATLGTTTYTEATTKAIIIGGVRRDADTTLVNTTNEITPMQFDANGRLKVEAFSGETLPVSLTSTTITGTVAVTQSGTWDEIGINDSGNSITVDQPTGTNLHVVTDSGTITTVSTVSALGTGTTGPQKAEDVASSGGDMGVAVMAARLDTPVANAGVSNDGDYTTPILDNFRKIWVSGTVPEDTAHVAGEALTVLGARRIDTAATSAGTSADWATVDASAEGALWTTSTPTTTSGCTIFRSLDIDETEEDVKTSAGNIYAIYFGNATSSIRYLKFYNATAANTTVGSTTPLLTFLIPASAAGWLPMPFPASFGTAICVACTTGVADADTGAPGANDVIINILYK